MRRWLFIFISTHFALFIVRSNLDLRALYIANICKHTLTGLVGWKPLYKSSENDWSENVVLLSYLALCILFWYFVALYFHGECCIHFWFYISVMYDDFCLFSRFSFWHLYCVLQGELWYTFDVFRLWFLWGVLRLGLVFMWCGFVHV